MDDNGSGMCAPVFDIHRGNTSSRQTCGSLSESATLHITHLIQSLINNLCFAAVVVFVVKYHNLITLFKSVIPNKSMDTDMTEEFLWERMREWDGGLKDTRNR